MPPDINKVFSLFSVWTKFKLCWTVFIKAIVSKESDGFIRCAGLCPNEKKTGKII